MHYEAISETHAVAPPHDGRAIVELPGSRAPAVAEVPRYDRHAIVELLGHRTLVGRCTVDDVLGRRMLVVDALDGAWRVRVNADRIYQFTEVTEPEARKAAARVGRPDPLDRLLRDLHDGFDDDDDDGGGGGGDGEDEAGAPELTVCIGCGCDDAHACVDAETGTPCCWLREDARSGLGVCSACEAEVERWDAGDRTPRQMELYVPPQPQSRAGQPVLGDEPGPAAAHREALILEGITVAEMRERYGVEVPDGQPVEERPARLQRRVPPICPGIGACEWTQGSHDDTCVHRCEEASP